MSYKLFIPGPVAVSEKSLKAMTRPIIGHRSKDFVALYSSIQPKLQTLFATEDPVYLSTSSAWGVMEASILNLTQKKVLNCMCGAFSDKWYDVSVRNGLSAQGLRVGWGQALDPEAIRQELSSGKYDVITLVHNETSTGVMSPLEDIMAVIREFPEVISIVDTVSSFSGVPIRKDELGIDVMLTGTQKALALPPGLALLSVSDRALNRAKTTPDRGYYFDFLEFQKNHEKSMTPSTPNIPLIYGLQSKLEDIFEEGLETRFARHERLNNKLLAWGTRHGFKSFPASEDAAKTLVCFDNLDESFDQSTFIERLKNEHRFLINGGYGKIKGRTFRISNMGDETDETMEELFQAMDTVIASM